ncbi:sensor histidine kinase [Thermomonospora umbrina]|uniref:histidine kinase n=1 Tax=Thermomonospora umbrina TaxID=111806 RepID=A0A3D9SY40_9ACTN|nr:histidine kinase [Thermomonospora umbrina]REE96531.1 signal transduction histidine kinase [Thermomonospora umbrina]
MRASREQKWLSWDDLLLTLVVGVMSVQETEARGGPLVVPAVVLAVAASLALVGRHRWPLAVTVAAVVAAAALGAALPLVVVLFHLASANRVAVCATAAVVVVVGNLFVDPAYSLWAPRDPGPVLLLVLPLALGMWAGSRRRLVVAMTEQIARLSTERELRAEHARMAERARIAAEMHDVLGHRLSVLALHTGALQRRAATLPPQVADRIALLRSTSTRALDDLRELLGALRNPTREDAAVAPPGAGELPALLEEARTAGQVIDAVIDGDPDLAPASHHLAVHRLVREGLTNVRKHAHPAAARMAVRYDPSMTTVSIENDPPLAPAGAESGGGYGLIGLTERVRALHGTIEYGRDDTGGWRLTARLPHGGDTTIGNGTPAHDPHVDRR